MADFHRQVLTQTCGSPSALMPQEVENAVKQWDYNEKLAMFMFQVRWQGERLPEETGGFAGLRQPSFLLQEPNPKGLPLLQERERHPLCPFASRTGCSTGTSS